MPGAYNVRVYFYTGFDTGNVPGDVSVLENATYKDYDAIFRFQSRSLASVRLNAPYWEIKDADYMRLTRGEDIPVYYVVTGVTMLSQQTAELSVIMDPLLSCGGLSKLSVIDGWVTRSHVGSGEDGLFDNILPEPWQPSNHLRIVDNPQLIHDTTGDTKMTVVGSTVDLYNLLNLSADVLSVAENPDANVVIPALPALSPELATKVSMLGFSYQLPTIGLYFYDSVRSYVADAIAKARQIGVDSALTAAYVLSREDVELTPYVPPETTTKWFPYAEIAGKTLTYDGNSKFKYAASKNNKVFAAYNTYSILSAASAARADFEAPEIYTQNDAPRFRVVIDPSPSGTAYAQPSVYEGRPVQRLEHAVAGLPWLNSGLAMEGASGGALSVANAGRRNKIIDYNAEASMAATTRGEIRSVTNHALGAIGDIVGGVTGAQASAAAYESGSLTDRAAALNPIRRAGGVAQAALGVAGHVANAAFDVWDAEASKRVTRDVADMQMGDNMFNARVSANIVAPEIAFPVSANNAAYFGNSFMIYHIGLSDNDVARFDKFLTMFGYSQDKPFVKTDLTNRQLFNYIKTSSAHLMAPDVSAVMLGQLGDMFNRGVRIWHTLPNADAYNDNPVLEA